MMPHDAFRLPRKFLAQLFGELGKISKTGVVDIDVLLALLNPNRPKQLVNLARLDLWDRELLAAVFFWSLLFPFSVRSIPAASCERRSERSSASALCSDLATARFPLSTPRIF
jgi:hypothetical protein